MVSAIGDVPETTGSARSVATSSPLPDPGAKPSPAPPGVANGPATGCAVPHDPPSHRRYDNDHPPSAERVSAYRADRTICTGLPALAGAPGSADRSTMRVDARRAALSAADSRPLAGVHPAPSERDDTLSTVPARHTPPPVVSNTPTRSPGSGDARQAEYGWPPLATSGGSTSTVPDATHTTDTPTRPGKSTAVSPRT